MVIDNRFPILGTIWAGWGEPDETIGRLWDLYLNWAEGQWYKRFETGTKVWNKLKGI